MTDEPRQYVLRKRGYFWRPNFSGYTSSLSDAGRYTAAEARAQIQDDDDPVTMHHISEFTGPAPGEHESARGVHDIARFARDASNLDDAAAAILAYGDQRAAEEREACAKVAESTFPRGSAHTYASENGCCYTAQEDTCEAIAEAIRNRGDGK